MNTNHRLIRPGIDFDAFGAYLKAVHATEHRRRCDELNAHAAESGNPLPMTPAVILAFEDAGAVVDLVTGVISWPNGVRAAPVLEGEVVVDIVAVKEA